ncbi:MAG: 50S ribosomal protein L13 [Nanoarchaeota archaeon]|nr:50S ribosomal protein L13 [Nanoarchaeota archaeon]
MENKSTHVKMIINAENLILGRLATYAAKQALLGEEIEIINCEKAILTGSKKDILKKYEGKVKMGTQFKGPFIHRHSNMIVKRTIRGMLPYKQEKGKKAFKNIRCHISIPDTLKDKEYETIKSANVQKLKNLKFITIQTLSKLLGK